MSAITDFADKVQANFDKLTASIDRLHKLITDFNNSPGTLSAADQAALDKIQAESQALSDAANSDVAPVVPPVPPTA